ncbi:hypothetical protein PHJA_001059200 [Phtheirospermum japonicum]|uniref:Uncharacterized protein n=1 Tax=Phtheirospermum japonicum TaxID=374723 RepID=A0A830C140_9LAMI|nr:hypothetical protein PHJA_001059200 [Phtheirospermum japonicum]
MKPHIWVNLKSWLRLYVQHVMSSVRDIYLEVMSPGEASSSIVTHEPILANLANLISQSYRLQPECVYANRAAHNMLQTTPEDLPMLIMDWVFGGSNFS